MLGRMEFEGWSLPNVSFRLLVSMTAKIVSSCSSASLLLLGYRAEILCP